MLRASWQQHDVRIAKATSRCDGAMALRDGEEDKDEHIHRHRYLLWQ